MQFQLPQSAVVTYLAITTLSAAVSSMPPPRDASKAWYTWFYKFSNAVMANVSAIRGKQQYLDSPPTPPPNANPPA